MNQRDIDEVIERVRDRLPVVVVRRHAATHAGDDDGIWWFSLPGVKPDVQVESPEGNCPFVVETDEQSSIDALRASSTGEAIQFIVEYLDAAAGGRSVRLDGERYWK